MGSKAFLKYVEVLKITLTREILTDVTAYVVKEVCTLLACSVVGLILEAALGNCKGKLIGVRICSAMCTKLACGDINSIFTCIKLIALKAVFVSIRIIFEGL